MAEKKKKVVKKVALDLKGKTIKELHEILATKQQELIDVKRGHKLGELTNPHFLTVTRKEIARILTAIGNAEKIAKKEEK